MPYLCVMRRNQTKINKVMTFEERVNKKFEETCRAIEEMEINGPEIFNHKLNDLQRFIIQTLKEREYFLNSSDTGTGKTKAAISAAYYLNAKHVLIFCPNSVKNTWKNQIEEANFISKENIKVDNIFNSYSDGNFTFEIFNYDKFNSDNRANKRIKAIIESKMYGLVVFDEAHRLKNKESKTYCAFMKLVHALRKLNPNVKFLGCTASPITTSNKDLQSIYELLSGKQADELTMGSLTNQLINANKVLETCGFGYFPKNKMKVRYNGIDSEELFATNGKLIYNTDLAMINGTSIEEDCIRCYGNRCRLEEIHMLLKFNAYKHLVKKGTIIYTEYTYGDKILLELKDLIEDKLHLSTCIYSGDYKEYEGGVVKREDGSVKTSIDEFVEGKKDVLISTKSMCEGVDGLQKVSNRIILHTIPSVWAILFQLIGRIARQGSKFFDKGVDVFVPMVVFYLSDGKTTSFDRRRWQTAMFRKRKDDIAKRGRVIEINLDEKEQLVNEVITKLKGKYEMTEIERKDVEYEDFEFSTPEWKKKKSLISDFNRRGKLTNSKRFHTEITENPTDWFEYHKARHENMKTWGEIPYEYIASKIKNKNRVVADFGCGENLMKTFIPNNKVYSFDHIAIDDSVIECDMSHTPLEDESIDIAVFSLALWGSNYEDYFKEAYRLLNYDGLMYIAEPTKSYDETQRDELVGMLKANGFTPVGNIEVRGKFFYITVIKK